MNDAEDGQIKGRWIAPTSGKLRRIFPELDPYIFKPIVTLEIRK